MDDVLMNKVAIIERSIRRVNEEFVGSEHQLETNYTKQDSMTLNLLRACEAAIDSAMHIVRVNKLAAPQSSRHAFELLEQAGLLSSNVSKKMKAMIGFRNIAVHDDQKNKPRYHGNDYKKHLVDLTNYTEVLLKITDLQVDEL